MYVNKPGYQSGATLVVALIILLVMTMVGVASMRGSTLQERMAANSQQYQLARNGAEHALRTAEDWITANVKSSSDFADFSNGTTGLYSAVKMPDTTSFKPLAFDIADDSAWTGQSIEVAAGLSASTTSQNPRYVIEYIGRGGGVFDNSGSPIKELGSGPTENTAPFFFRITAIGFGRDANIYSVLESTYRTGSSDYFTY